MDKVKKLILYLFYIAFILAIAGFIAFIFLAKNVAGEPGESDIFSLENIRSILIAVLIIAPIVLFLVGGFKTGRRLDKDEKNK